MKMNRIQFQPGLSMPEFFERYGSEVQCQAALQATRWPDGFACPKCGGAARSRFVRGGLPYWQCGACPHQTSLISGTVFEASKLPLTRRFLAMQLLTQSKNNVSALELKRQLGVSYRSAWLIKHKIMQAMRLAEQDRELDGRIEIDDAYLGGEFSGKSGRDSDNKVPFVAAVQTREECHPLYLCLSQQPPTNETMAAFAASHIAPSATVVSDGLWCFAAATLVGAEYERIVTGGGKASMALPQFKWVNTLRAFLGLPGSEGMPAWKGKLVTDDFSGYKACFELGVTESGCMAHARRKFHELWVHHGSALGEQALKFFVELYKIERELRDLPADARKTLRQERSMPIADALRQWLTQQRQKVPDGSATARAIDYSLKRWRALTRYLDDGHVPIDNNAVENSIRPLALGRKNWMFAGSLRAGKRAAAVMSLVHSARLNGHDPYTYLRDVLERLPTQTNRRIAELLPHRWQPADNAA